MTTTTSRRWALVNRRTANVRRAFDTRAAARSYKRSTERIYDRSKNVFVR